MVVVCNSYSESATYISVQIHWRLFQLLHFA